jgi:acetoin:2,6-dichlorophenolindophenol oxidoreductase subunit alpha
MEPTPDQRLELHRQMLRAAEAEVRILRLIDEGHAQVLYHSARGQEAVAAGAIAPLRDDDYLLYGHRGVGHMLAKGLDPVELFGDILANDAGATRGLGAGIIHCADPRVGILGQSGTVGGNFVIAAGVGLSIVTRGTDQVVVCFFGDGTANRGTFHEAANAAGVWKLPVVWVCENNGYAVSVPASESTAVTDIADRAAGYGMPGVVVDGQDPVAVFDAVSDAVARARAGDGPSLVEAKTYRLRGHFEGDPEPYRQAAEVDGWRARDPIPAHAQRLEDNGVATTADLDALLAEVRAELDAAVETAMQAPMPDRDRIFQGILA